MQSTRSTTPSDMKLTDIDYKKIPVQAGIIANIINLDVESHTCFRDLDELISSDQGVASLVLRVSNSALYNRGNKVSTIPLAISLLGHSVVRSLALLAFSRSLFMQTKDANFRTHVWQHSLLVAIASQDICVRLGHARLSDEAFIAGLVHDIGKVLIFTHDPAAYAKVFEGILEAGRPSIQVEMELFGINHGQVGMQAATEWRLPPRFNDYMGCDSACPSREDSVMLSLLAANKVVKAAGFGARRVDDVPLTRAALVGMGLDEPLCDALLSSDYIEQLMQHDTYKLCASM